MKAIKIKNGGPLTTVQDEGRFGYQKFGMPVAGAMDKFSFKIANLLVGNKKNKAVLEYTVKGPKLEFIKNSVIAITGANAVPKINGKSIPMWTSIFIKKGSILSFGNAKKGLRGYIAFKNGIKIPEVMGSRATYLRGEIGGFEGRKLKSEDVLELRKDVAKSDFCKKCLPKKYRPNFSQNKVRVIMGPQDNYFSEKGLSNFLNEKFKVSSQADRMGYRLNGPQIEHKNGADIISDGIAAGSIQVSGDGKPIIMLADRQTTGGYTKIATVITVDLDIVAQKRPGDSLNFEKISLEEAQKLLKERRGMYNKIKKKEEKLGSSKHYNIKIDGEEFEVELQEII